MEYIWIGVVIILMTAAIVGMSVNRASFCKYEQIVKETSLLYKALTELNRKQRFNKNISAKYEYRTYFKSKRSSDNMSLTNFLMQTLIENESFFDNMFVRLQENKKLWNTYLQEYANLKLLTTNEIEKLIVERNLKIKSKKYHRHEMRL